MNFPDREITGETTELILIYKDDSDPYRPKRFAVGAKIVRHLKQYCEVVTQNGERLTIRYHGTTWGKTPDGFVVAYPATQANKDEWAKHLILGERYMKSAALDDKILQLRNYLSFVCSANPLWENKEIDLGATLEKISQLEKAIDGYASLFGEEATNYKTHKFVIGV